MNPVNLAHVLFTGPLMIYIGLIKPQYTAIYYGLYVLATLLTVYFIYKVVTRTSRPWHLVHLIVFFPLLFYLAYKKTNAHPFAFSLLMAIGCAAFGYHLIRLLPKKSMFK